MNLRAALGVGAMVAVPLVAYQPVGATAEPPSPATGHAEVVAQGIVTFDDGPAHWQLTANPATETETDIDTSSPTFIMSEGPHAVVVSGPTGPVARIAEGEAVFRAAGDTTLLRSASATGGDAAALSVNPSAGDPDATFTPGPGTRDVDLVRDVLNVNEALLLHTDVSAFVIVKEGTVTVGNTTVGAGATAMLTGDLTLINTSPGPAIVAVAVIGPLLSDSETTAPVTQSPAPSVNAPSPESPTPTNAPAATTTTTTATATTTTNPDRDGDGLLDVTEAQLGTDPNKSDTDGDELSDGEEVAFRSNPLAEDTDGDRLDDWRERDFGTDPNRPDTDGDSMGDQWEVDSMPPTDPLKPDTDDDGLNDNVEDGITLTDPNDADSDDDQMLDGFEFDHELNPLNPDSDGDGLIENVDWERCNAYMPDTDGDGRNDYTEHHSGTDCRNPDS